MLRNFFITSVRYLFRNKIPSLIKLISLVIGMVVIIIILLYWDYAYSHDQSHENRGRIFRLELDGKTLLPTAVGHEIKTQISEVANMVRISIGERRIKYIDDLMKEGSRNRILKVKSMAADSTIFRLFTMPFIQGDPSTALVDPYSVVLTETIANNLFGSQDPVGKFIEFEQIDSLPNTYHVTGVIKDLELSHFEFDILTSMTTYNEVDKIVPLKWGDSRLNTYVHRLVTFTYLMLDHKDEQERIKMLLSDHFQEKLMSQNWLDAEGSKLDLLPMDEIYFNKPQSSERGKIKHGNPMTMKILLAIAVLILIISSVNYINLTIAHGSLRVSEVYVRRAVGSTRYTLVVQFLVESVLIALISLAMAITTVQLILPLINKITLEGIRMAKILEPAVLLGLLCGSVMLGLMAGLYPAIKQTGRAQSSGIWHGGHTARYGNYTRKVLLILQYSISIMLIISLFTVVRQLRFMQHSDLGFEKDLVINFKESPLDGYGNKEPLRKVFRETLIRYPEITSVAYGQYPGMTRKRFGILEHEGMKITSNWLTVDPAYFDLYGMKIVEGRNFSPSIFRDLHGNDSLRRVVINETFKRKYNLDSPVGVIIDNWLEIIGVVEDYHFVSLRHEIEPTHFTWSPYLTGTSIKIRPGNIPETLKKIESTFYDLFPDHTFEYSFMDEWYNQQYGREQREILGTGILTILAVLLSCMGLFGLAFFMAARRTKEIGIRKAVGASDRTVFILLTKDFIKWVTISVLIACPFGWIIMDNWLQNFAYRTNVSILHLALAAFLTYAISFITVAWHAWKTARTNPVEALRYE